MLGDHSFDGLLKKTEEMMQAAEERVQFELQGKSHAAELRADPRKVAALRADLFRRASLGRDADLRRERSRAELARARSSSMSSVGGGAPGSPLPSRALGEASPWKEGEEAHTLTVARPVAPFRMQLSSCDFGAMGFEYDHGEYLVDIDSSQLERVKAAGFGGSSQMTPLRRINLPNAEQELNIPKEATMFAWAFPLHALGGSVGFAPQTPEEEAAVHGAFAYFKDADHLVAINAVRATPSGGLHCGGPHLLRGATAAVSDGTRMPSNPGPNSSMNPIPSLNPKPSLNPNPSPNSSVNPIPGLDPKPSPSPGPDPHQARACARTCARRAASTP